MMSVKILVISSLADIGNAKMSVLMLCAWNDKHNNRLLQYRVETLYRVCNIRKKICQCFGNIARNATTLLSWIKKEGRFFFCVNHNREHAFNFSTTQFKVYEI